MQLSKNYSTTTCQRTNAPSRCVLVESIVKIIVLLGLLARRSDGQYNPNGQANCPCLSYEEIQQLNSSRLIDLDSFFGPNVNRSAYGIGCAPHDKDNIACADPNECTSIVPLPPGCDQSYCKREWCFVDQSCALASSQSTVFSNRDFSYATCGHLDRFTYSERMKSLGGKVFKVGFVSNSGGWKGSYNPQGSFASNPFWNGPMVDYIREAALVGGFTINRTAPPDHLLPQSQEFFGSSSFDYCVFATSLGYLDFCVGGFTITQKRASITTMFETSADPLYMVTFNEEGSTSFQNFYATTLTIFRPFTGASWGVIFLIALPVLALLMFYHEYGQPGSSFPKVEPILAYQKENGEVEVLNRPITLTQHIGSAFYTGILSFFTGSYDLSVITPGGKVNLLAISSFVMLILAVYTANLAAILTENVNNAKIDSLELAVKAGYNFCAERKMAEVIMDLYTIEPENIVPDPVSLGGDGLPGFNCPDCKSRERVLDYMRRSHNDKSLYCNAAIVNIEDLEVMHKFGRHCDKGQVGEHLAYTITGIPIFDKNAATLTALFHKLKSEGTMESKMNAAKPQNRCPVNEGEGSSLNPQQLTGVWVITTCFAVIGLLLKYCAKTKPWQNNAEEPTTVEMKLRRFDQWLNPPGYDVIVQGYRYDGENNIIIQKGEGTLASDNKDSNKECKVGEKSSEVSNESIVSTREDDKETVHV